MISRSHHLTRRSGFTLLELVLVMAILCIICSLAVPSLRGFGHGRNMPNAADQIVSLTRWAHTQSITRSETYRFNLDVSSRTFWVTVQKDGAFNAPEEDFGQVFTISDDVQVSWDAPQKNGGGQAVEFRPDGRTEAATIRLTDAQGRVTEIACRSATEMFHVVTDEERQNG